jgi:predicted DNA-binding protein (UPF0251 family)
MKAGDPISILQLTREHIRLIVEQCSTRQEAADLLGIHRSTLPRLLRRLKIALILYPFQSLPPGQPRQRDRTVRLPVDDSAGSTDD